jgi:peptide/nickel transport system substrate-binding protein
MALRTGSSAAGVVVAVLSLGLFAAVVSCDRGPRDAPIPTPSEQSLVTGGHLRFALPHEPGGLDPTAARFSPDELQVARAIFDPLLTIDESSELRPGLATEVEPNADLTVWTITLRTGVTFSDGAPVDAAAVKASLDTSRQSAALASLLDPIDTVEVIDDHTVRVELRSPWAAFAQILAEQPGLVSAPGMRAAGDPARMPVGSGPFVLDRWDAGREIVLKKRPDYWREGLPRLDGVTFVVTPDEATRLAAVRRGSVDVARLVEPWHMARASMATEEELQVLRDKSDDTPELVIVLNTVTPPFDDLAARAALAFSLDRDALSREVFHGEFLPADGPFSEGSRFYGQAHWPILDVAHAAEMARDYEHRSGRALEFRLSVGPGLLDLELARRIAEQAAVVGIVVKLDVAPDSDLVRARVERGDFDAAMLPLFAGSHPDEDYELLHSGGGVVPPGSRSANLARFANRVIDDALDAARRDDDITAQAERYQQVQEELSQQLPYVFLVHVPSLLVARPGVRGLFEWTTPSGEPGVRQWRSTVSLESVWIESPSGVGGEGGR